MVPIRAQALGGCALESSFQGGVKREQLRGLCQVLNITTLPLQVALATVAPQADEWQMVPQQAAADRSHSRHSSASSQVCVALQQRLIWMCVANECRQIAAAVGR